MEFKVKRDFLSIFLVSLLIAFLFAVSIPFSYNTVVFIIVFAIVLAVAVFYETAVIFASCKIEEGKLTYRTGVFKYEIDLKSITKVQKSKNCHASLALSTERVRIVTKENGQQKVYYISVVDRDKLISILKESIAKDEEKQPAVKKTEKKVTAKKQPAKKK